MEHRHHARFTADLQMLIYRRGLPVATGTLRNVSVQGLFVETDYADLHPHQHLECEFRSESSTTGEWHRVGAWVSRRARRGIGLEVDDADRRNAQILEELTHGRKVAIDPAE